MKKERKSQKNYILTHLMRFGSIEPLTALREYGAYRLGAIIFLLRQEGYNIVKKRMEGVSKITGNRIMYARYYLRKK